MATDYRWIEERTYFGPMMSQDLIAAPILDLGPHGVAHVSISCKSKGSSSVSYYLQTAIADDPSMWTRATDTFAFASGSKRQIVLKASSTTYSSGILERYIRLVVVPDVNETWWATVQAEVTGHDNPA